MQGAPGEQLARAGTSPAPLTASLAQTRIYPPQGPCLAPAVPAAWSQACPRPARLAPPVPARWAPCVTPCPSLETSSPWGHPWASLGGLRDRHDPSKALNRSLGRSDTRSPGFGWGRKCPDIPCPPQSAPWRLLPWLSHGESGSKKQCFYCDTPPPVLSTQHGHSRGPPQQAFVSVWDRQIYNWRPTSLPETP